MHGEVDGAGEERLLDLFGEQALAADLGERPIADQVAGGADDLDRDPLGAEPVGGGEPRAHLMRLGERERAAARADAQDGGRRWRRGLNTMT
jgi:hypothetical protein